MNKSPTLTFNNCKLNLKEFQGKWTMINMYKCECYDDFQKRCDLQHLQVEYSQISIKQLAQLELLSLKVYYKQQNNIDLSLNTEIRCSDKYLSITEQKVNLNIFSGQWEHIYLTYCEYTGELQSNSLRVNSINIYQKDINNLNMFNNLQCNQIHIYAKSNSQMNELYLDNVVPFNNLVKRNLQTRSIHLIGYNCNLNDASGQWNNIILENCFIYGSQQNNSNKFKNTNILVKLNQIYNNMTDTFDFNPLQISSKLTVEIDKDVTTDFRSLILCRPNIVKLYYQEIDLKLLSGTWNDLLFANCEFVNGDNIINAKTVKIFKPDIQNFGEFICDQLTLSNTEVKELSKAKRICMSNVTININKPNPASYLFLSKCLFKRFSLTLFPNLETVQIQFDKKNQIGYVFNSFLDQKMIRNNQKKKNIQIITLENIQMNQFKERIKILTVGFSQLQQICLLFYKSNE
ncbi:Hypothetical_protein [Hexamita inflata]|uniref:Hypothetical_protein n=1 Tax=Hexamita inflata TaxID=28002 RepID=A0AA86V5H7_9EUKA|nr:Hypothetical protein HINF_LOCUS45063 [Hexamita inflata]